MIPCISLMMIKESTILMTGAVCIRIHLDKTIFPSMSDYYKNKVGYRILEESYLKRFSVFQEMRRQSSIEKHPGEAN